MQHQNANMNKYTCTSCGKISVVMSTKPELQASCTCAPGVKTLKRGLVIVKAGIAQDKIPQAKLPETASAPLPQPPVTFDPSKVTSPAAATIKPA